MSLARRWRAALSAALRGVEDGLTPDDGAMLRGLIDTLLPGGHGFPAASATGMVGPLAARLDATDAALLGRLATGLRTQGTLPDGEEGWSNAVAQLEASEPKLFDEVRKYAYLTYYEQGSVIAAIRALGLRYNDAPLPEGYPAEPFDAATDAPRHARGRWIATEQVQPVDVSRLGLRTVP